MTRAHSSTGAVRYDPGDLIELFGISAKELGRLTRRSERSVRRWIAGSNPPKGLARHRLATLARIAYYLEAGPEEAPPDELLRTPNAGLGGRVPLDILDADGAFMVAQFLGSWSPMIESPYGTRGKGGFPGSSATR